MRGKARFFSSVGFVMGITPAYAGKRERAVLYSARCAGSPPPMRGKVAVSTSNGSRHRITPAYAGKSLTMPENWTA